MTCEEFEEVRDLHALGALSPEEAEGAEEHLEQCASCAARARDSWGAAQLLRHAVPPLAPSPAAAARLAQTIRDDVGAGLKPAPTAGEARPRTPRLRPAIQWAVAAAALPIMLSAWLGLQVVSLQRQVDSTALALERSSQNSQAAAEVMGEAIERGGAMSYLEGTDMAPGAIGTLYYMPTQQQGVLVVAGLPPLAEGRIYQLWLVEEAARSSGGTFSLEPDGRGMLIVKSPKALATFQALGITDEPREGSALPSGQRYMWGQVRPT